MKKKNRDLTALGYPNDQQAARYSTGRAALSSTGPKVFRPTNGSAIDKLLEAIAEELMPDEQYQRMLREIGGLEPTFPDPPGMNTEPGWYHAYVGSSPSISMTAGAGLALLAIGVLADCAGGVGLGTLVATYAVKGLAIGAGGAAGNAVWDSLKSGESRVRERLRDPRKRLKNHDLQALAGRAIAVVTAAAARDFPGGSAGRRYLERIAKRFPADWSSAKLDERYAEILDQEIPKFFGRADGSMPKANALNVKLWQELVGSLANKKTVDADEQAALAFAANRLYEQFPRALFELAKEDFSPESPGSPHDGKAFAALLLSLINNTMGGIGELLAKQDEVIRGNKQILDELVKLRMRLAERSTRIARLAPKDIAAIVQPLKREIDVLSGELADVLGILLTSVSELRDQVDVVGEAAGSAHREAKRGADAAARTDAAITSGAFSVAVANKVVAAQAKFGAGTFSIQTITARNNLAAAKVTPNRFFTGRTDELTCLHAALANGDVAIVHALAGEGGIGKTELAKAYALVFADEYDGVWWIDAASNALPAALASVFKLATGLQLPQGATPAELCQFLADRWGDHKHLIVLDNVDDPANFTLFGPMRTARVLATTRLLEKTLEGVHSFRVDVLEPEDAVAIMYKEIAEHRQDVAKADLAAIALELGYHALAVALTGAYLANYPNVPAPTVLARIKASGVGDIDPVSDESQHDALGLAYRRSVKATLELHFDRPDVKSALPLLAAAAFLHPAGITMDLLAAGAALSPDHANKAARALAKVSIIKYETTVSVHRLTQGVSRARDDIGGGRLGEVILQRLLQVLVNLFTDTEWNDLAPTRDASLQHVEAVMSFAELPQYQSSLAALVAALRADVAVHIGQTGRYDVAHVQMEAAVKWFECQTAPDEGCLAKCYAGRASIRQYRGDLDGSIEDINNAICCGESQDPRDERRLAFWYGARARVYVDRGEDAIAYEDIAKSIAWFESQSPRDERNLAMQYSTRAGIHRKLRNFEEAHRDITTSIEMRKGLKPPDDRGLSIDYAERARILKYLGQHTLALEDINAAIRMVESRPRSDQREIAINLTERALIHLTLGDLDGAEQDNARSIAWEQSRSPANLRELAIRFAHRSRIRTAQAIAERKVSRTAEASALFAQAKADNATALKWFEDHLPSDVRSIEILRNDKSTVESAENGH